MVRDDGYPYRGNVRPASPVRINWDSPQARGLVGTWLAEEGHATYEPVRGVADLWTYMILKPDTGGGGKAMGSSGVGCNIAFNPYLPATLFTAGLTFVVDFTPCVWFGANPGIWRSAATCDGWEFCIFQNTSGRPWIRWKANNILQPTSGWSATLGKRVHMVWSIQSLGTGSWVRVYADGVLVHEATHNQNGGPASGIYKLGYQGSIGYEYVDAEYVEWRFYNSALNDAECINLYAPESRWDLYAPA